MQNFRRLAIGVALTGLSSVACQTENREAHKPKVASGSKDKSESHPKSLEKIAHVPVGTFLAGSYPGEPGRDPALEPARKEVELGPFRIDALPYPGEPGQAPKTGVSQREAGALCAAREGRLCTELEWERACRGPDSATYPGGNSPCDSKEGCVSGFNVGEMGSILEWTASEFGKDSDHRGRPAARGAEAKVPSSERRCARRRSPKKDQAVGFRCCYGAPNASSIEEPTLGPAYEEEQLSPKELKALLESDEKTKALAKEARLFKPEAARTVLSRGPGQSKGFQLTTAAVKWQPSRGSRFLVVAGRSGKDTSFVLAYFLSDNQKTLAGSFIMKNEAGPIALAYAPSIRPRIHFSSCWGCPGETGKVLFREPEELVLLQP